MQNESPSNIPKSCIIETVMDQFFEKRVTELCENSRKNGTFYFTDFLSEAESSEVMRLFSEKEVTLFGGAEETERKMARFGDPEELGYEIPFPIVLLRIRPLQAKFADALTHRDFLGALMNLGIERDVIGDIVVREHTAYLFVAERMSEMIMQELTRVKHTQVMAERLFEPPEDVKPRFVRESLIVSSLRLDLIASKIYRLSRQVAKDLFTDGKVFLNGRLCTNPASPIKEGDVLSVRGCGKFVFRSIDHETKKGNLAVSIDRYA